MSVTDYSLKLKGRLNAALPGILSTILATIGFGDWVRSQRTALRNQVALANGVNKYVLSTANSISLPEDAKASQIVRAYARAGTGTKGYLTVDAPEVNTAPAAGHISISANGDLVMANADAWTLLDIEYLPEIGDVVEVVLTAASANTFNIPASLTARGVLRLIEAEATAGTLVQQMTVDIPADGLPATGHAALKLAKNIVQFANADAVTTARLKLIVASAIDVNGLLEATSTID